MGTTENFCLRWNDFESNLSTAFRELRDDADFFDVTLATDEDEVKAHKVVLSACSPHLKQVSHSSMNCYNIWKAFIYANILNEYVYFMP